MRYSSKSKRCVQMKQRRSIRFPSIKFIQTLDRFFCRKKRIFYNTSGGAYCNKINLNCSNEKLFPRKSLSDVSFSEKKLASQNELMKCCLGALMNNCLERKFLVKKKKPSSDAQYLICAPLSTQERNSSSLSRNKVRVFHIFLPVPREERNTDFKPKQQCCSCVQLSFEVIS